MASRAATPSTNPPDTKTGPRMAAAPGKVMHMNKAKCRTKLRRMRLDCRKQQNAIVFCGWRGMMMLSCRLAMRNVRPCFLSFGQGFPDRLTRTIMRHTNTDMAFLALRIPDSLERQLIAASKERGISIRDKFGASHQDSNLMVNCPRTPIKPPFAGLAIIREVHKVSGASKTEVVTF